LLKLVNFIGLPHHAHCFLHFATLWALKPALCLIPKTCYEGKKQNQPVIHAAASKVAALRTIAEWQQDKHHFSEDRA
jgi:hypothetical protein